MSSRPDYVVTVRGPIPPDLAERIEAAHAAAVLAQPAEPKPEPRPKKKAAARERF